MENQPQVTRTFEISTQDDSLLNFLKNEWNALAGNYKIKKAEWVSLAIALLRELKLEKHLSDKKSEVIFKFKECRTYEEVEKVIIKLFKEKNHKKNKRD